MYQIVFLSYTYNLKINKILLGGAFSYKHLCLNLCDILMNISDVYAVML